MRVLPGLLFFLSGCAGRQLPPSSTADLPTPVVADEGPPAPEVSRRLSYFVYVEEGKDLIFTVGVRAAAFHEMDEYFPLEIAVVNRMKGATWIVTRDSFTLLDEAGTRYRLPTECDLMKNYTKQSFDLALFDARSVTAGKLEGYFQVESNFFPDPHSGVFRRPDTVSGGSGVRPRSKSLVPYERVELPPFRFLEDVLYFPHPAGKLVGQKLTLAFHPQGISEPARVAFRVRKIHP